MLSCFSHVQLSKTQWTTACQALLPVGFSRHEYWRGLPCPSPGDLPNSGTEPRSLTSPSLAGRFFTISTTWEALLGKLWMGVKGEENREFAAINSEILARLSVTFDTLCLDLCDRTPR